MRQPGPPKGGGRAAWRRLRQSYAGLPPEIWRIQAVGALVCLRSHVMLGAAGCRLSHLHQNRMPDALDLLKTRRSVKPIELNGPRPSAAELDAILTVASRVPDHG